MTIHNSHQAFSDSNKYNTLMRVMHWLMAILIIGMLALGLYMDELPDDAPNRMDLYRLHKSIGVIVLALIAVRIVIRLFSRVPPVPTALSSLEKIAATVGHKLLYLLMILVPLSGFVMSSANPKRYGVELFGYRLPDLPASEMWAGIGHELHGPTAWALLIVVVIHVAAVIKHRVFDRPAGDVLPRMLP